MARAYSRLEYDIRRSAFAAVGKLSERTGLTEFQDTLDISLLNLDYFMRNRTPGATKFLKCVKW